MERTVARTTFPYPLIWDRGKLEISVEDKPFQVVFERRYHEAPDKRPPTGSILSAPDHELPYDRLGRVAYTHVEIYFPMYVENDLTDREDLWNWVHAIINRLLSVYRYSMEEFYIDTVPKDELNIQAITTIDEHGKMSGRETMIGFQAVGNRWLTSARTQPIPDEARRILRDGTELPISRVLFLNAKREHLLENYRIAVVEAATAFEVLIDQFVTQHYRRQGLPDTEILKKLETNLVNLLRYHIPRCCKEAFEGTPEHRAWEADLYTLRKSVVHDGASVSAEQASQALDAAERAMGWIEVRAAA
jgi:hypothetical protein